MSIDNYLGPASGRFFGDGFRRVEHAIRDLSLGLTSTGHFGVTGRAALLYPTDWSTKPTKGDLKPHLSTVDGFVIAAQLVEVLLATQMSLDVAERTYAWIRAVEFKSGAAPTEHLDDFPVEAHVSTVRSTTTALKGGYESTAQVRIGGMKIRMTVRHSVSSFVARAGRLGDVDEILGDVSARFYGSGFKSHFHTVDQVDCSSRDSISARVLITPSVQTEWVADLGGKYRPSVSILDCIIAQSQMSQVLMYKLDDLDRSASNTLWMRRVSIEASSPFRPLDDAFTASAHVVKSQTLTVQGATFRTVEFVGTFQGLRSRYSLAHQLPSLSEGEPAHLAVTPV